MIGLRDDAEFSPTPSSRPGQARPLTSALFSEGGILQCALKLEYRPQQEEMASAVVNAFAADLPLLFEAGTGVGKSLAYLLPGIVQAIDQNRQMIVSTHTISLQEQLETKDLPLCRRVLSASAGKETYASFKSCVLLGKGNYLCTTRLTHALADRGSLLPDDEYGELQRIAAWAEKSETGLRHDLRPPPRAEVWDLVNADSSSCTRKHCTGGSCFYQRARARLRDAHVIIVNHALLFALIHAGGARAAGGKRDARGVLFPDDFVVLDEAHTVPEVASDHFGLHLSNHGIERALKHLFNPRTKRGLFKKHALEPGPQLVVNALEASQFFFGGLAGSLLAQRAIARLREAGSIEPLLDGPLGALDRHLAKLADRLDEGLERDELLEQRTRIKALQAGISEWLNLAESGI